MQYCKPMKKHFITTAAGNAAFALSMAKEVWIKEVLAQKDEQKEAPRDLQDMVELIDITSRKLIEACERYASEFENAN